MKWPAERSCPFDDRTPNLRACWGRSRGLLSALRDRLVTAGVAERVRTVYVSGSLGRMEVVGTSDCDAVVVLTEEDRLEPGDVMDVVFDCVEAVGFQRPKPAGIFGSPTSFEQLLDPSTAGKVDEDQGVFGKRIQALLDSQSLLHAGEFEQLQSAILERYVSAPRADKSAFEYGWLLDDLIRYWRSLCARTRWFCHDDMVQWRAVNVKLRHSRMLLCAGLFRLLYVAATVGCELRDELKLVPAERVFPDVGTGEALLLREDALLRYDAFMGAMQENLKDVVRDDSRFAQLIDNGATLSRLVGQCLQVEFGDRVANGLFGELS